MRRVGARLAARMLAEQFFKRAWRDYEGLQRVGVIKRGRVNPDFVWQWWRDDAGTARPTVVGGCKNKDEVQELIDWWRSDWPEFMAEATGFDMEDFGGSFDLVRRKMDEK